MNAPIGRVAAARHFLDLSDFDSATLKRLIADARRRKDARVGLPQGAPDADAPLTGRVLALIFDRPSTRTRISFDIAMRQLGGTTLTISGSDMQLARAETMADTARVLSRYVDAAMIRMLDHAAVQELADNATIPVINGLTKLSHPCQVMADVMTFEEHKGPIAGRVVAWSGAPCNVLASWVHAAARLGFTLRVATPQAHPVCEQVQDWARRSRGDIVFGHDPEAAVTDADCVVTDAWLSMGDAAMAARNEVFGAYRVNAALMARARGDAIFMHCLPAHRGEEVTDEVIDGPQSVVFDEAENRLHAQKAILAWCLG